MFLHKLNKHIYHDKECSIRMIRNDLGLTANELNNMTDLKNKISFVVKFVYKRLDLWISLQRHENFSK